MDSQKEMSLFPEVKNLTWKARDGTDIANSVTAAWGNDPSGWH